MQTIPLPVCLELTPKTTLALNHVVGTLVKITLQLVVLLGSVVGEKDLKASVNLDVVLIDKLALPLKFPEPVISPVKEIVRAVLKEAALPVIEIGQVPEAPEPVRVGV